MKKNGKKIVVAILLGCMLTGCGANDANNSGVTEESGEANTAGAGDTIIEDVGEVVEDVADTVMEPLDLIPGMPDTVTTQASEGDRHPELESLIQSRYEISEENLMGTRYYYNRMDLNADGTDEMIAIVMGDGINQAGVGSTDATGGTGAGTDAGTEGSAGGGTDAGTAGSTGGGTDAGTAGTTTGGGTDTGATGSTGATDTAATDTTGNLLILSTTEDGTWQIMQEFEGVQAPIIVSDTVTNGYRDLIVMNTSAQGEENGTGAGGSGTGTGTAGNSGTGETGGNEDVMEINDTTAGSAISGTPRGGSNSGFLRLTYEDGSYIEIENAQTMDTIDSITGTALLYNDFQSDFTSGDYLSLGEN